MRYLVYFSYKIQDKGQVVTVLLRKSLETHWFPDHCPLYRKHNGGHDTYELPTASGLGAESENKQKNNEWLIAI